MRIQVMGPGCPNCLKVAEMVQDVLAETSIKADIEKVTDFQEMAKAGVFSTPAVVIDGKIKCAGSVPSRQQIKSWLG